MVLSDNGSEFEADFARLLEDRGIKRWYTYPKTPKMTARGSLQSHDPGVLRG
jgi:transposase InsO family protein